MFDSIPTYSPYRSLHLTDPHQSGEDVYGLQIALNYVLANMPPLEKDGVLGKQTAEHIVSAQRILKLFADGVAGQLTQRALALFIGHGVKEDVTLPKGLPGGQLEHESSFRLGNYSPQRPNGTYDAGVAQRNTEHTPAKDGFDPVDSIYVLCHYVRGKYNAFSKVEGRRRWELAVGAWNAPAYADYYAGLGGLKPGPEDAATWQAYIDSCMAYVQLS